VRVAYLDWGIVKLGAAKAAWRAQLRAENPPTPGKFSLVEYIASPFSNDLQNLHRHRNGELADNEPLPRSLLIPVYGKGYSAYHDTKRWERKRQRKLVSVSYQCEEPGCTAQASHCHHLHYDNVGFEENCDLEALCEPHHKARHPGWR
jgi:hypothetical protein